MLISSAIGSQGDQQMIVALAELRRCSLCQIDKPKSEFYRKYKTRPNSFQSRCKDCINDTRKAFRRTAAGKISDREWLMKQRRTTAGVAKELWQRARTRAIKIGCQFDLPSDWIESRVKAGVCEATGIPFDCTPAQRKRIKRPFFPSIDRIDSDLGYTPNNCRLVVCIYNMAKHVWTHSDVMKLAAALIDPGNTDAKERT